MMKKLAILFLMVIIVSNANAIYFDIAPAAGYSEPLSQGDVIEISATTQPSPGYSFAYSSFRLYYNTFFPINRSTSTSPAQPRIISGINDISRVASYVSKLVISRVNARNLLVVVSTSLSKPIL